MEILFEDKNIVAINKPAGMLVHDDGSGDKNTVVDWVLKKYPEIASVGEEVRIRTGEVVKKPGIVHRLDKETSGVLIIAKNQETFRCLKEQFQEHKIQKTYQAFVYGNIKEDQGKIDRPIGKSNKDFRKYSAQRGARGTLREALTLFKVLKRSKEVSLVEVYPQTGRTHQIRVHFKAIHHPIVADRLYAPKGQKLLGFQRVALHARAIGFRDINDREISIEAPYPADFEQALVELGTLC